jgi:hypothetical protein
VYMYSKFVPPQPPVSPPSSTQNVWYQWLVGTIEF